MSNFSEMIRLWEDGQEIPWVDYDDTPCESCGNDGEMEQIILIDIIIRGDQNGRWQDLEWECQRCGYTWIV